MNTPTPEDIALANEIADAAVCDGGGYYYDIAAQVIADHCAPLRERIAALEDHLKKEADGNRELMKECERLEELAEIGRLAVEHRRMSSGALAPGQWYAKLTEVNAACDNYITKPHKPV
jgi:hypothetical protein